MGLKAINIRNSAPSECHWWEVQVALVNYLQSKGIKLQELNRKLPEKALTLSS